jgi:hypothetical protein
MNSINQLVFVQKTQFVFCELGTEVLFRYNASKGLREFQVVVGLRCMLPSGKVSLLV